VTLVLLRLFKNVLRGTEPRDMDACQAMDPCAMGDLRSLSRRWVHEASRALACIFSVPVRAHCVANE
jgi:hypothetical protein